MSARWCFCSAGASGASNQLRQAKLSLRSEAECHGFYEAAWATYPFGVPFQTPVDMGVHVCAGHIPGYGDACYVRA